MKIRKNQKGFSHDFLLPVLVILAVGAMGTYFLSRSNANSLPPENGPIVYTADDQFKTNIYRINADGSGKTLVAFGRLLDTSRDQKWALISPTGADYVAVNILDPSKRYAYPKPTITDPNCQSTSSQNKLYTVYVDAVKFKQGIKNSMPPNVYMSTRHYPCNMYAYNSTTFTGAYIHDMAPNSSKPVATPVSFNKSVRIEIKGVGQRGVIALSVANYLRDYESGVTGDYVRNSQGKLKKLPRDRNFINSDIGLSIVSQDGKKYGDKYSINARIASVDKLSKVTGINTLIYGRTFGLNSSGSMILYDHNESSYKSRSEYLRYYSVSTKKFVNVDSVQNMPDYSYRFLAGSWSNRNDSIAYVKNTPETGVCELKVYSLANPSAGSKSIDRLKACKTIFKPLVYWGN